MGIYFLVCFSLLFLGKCGAHVSLEKIFWGPERYGHWVFQEKCVSGYWDLIFRNGKIFGIRRRGWGGVQVFCCSAGDETLGRAEGEVRVCC